MERDCQDCPNAMEGAKCGAPSFKPCANHKATKAAERASILARLKIRTEHVYPPIPVREWDWSAVDDNTYEPGCPIGWGRTEQAAVDDLVRQYEEMEG